MKKPSSYERRSKSKVTISLYVDADVRDAFRDLAAATRVSQSDYMREALDDLLAKYRRQLNAYYRKERKS